jgi:hypothetical protein
LPKTVSDTGLEIGTRALLFRRNGRLDAERCQKPVSDTALEVRRFSAEAATGR